jgi:starch synthase
MNPLAPVIAMVDTHKAYTPPWTAACTFPILAPTMDLLFVSPSAVPFPVEAGPSEACNALAKAMKNLGHTVTVVTPLPEEAESLFGGLARRLDPLVLDIGGRRESVFVHDARSAAGIDYILLDHPALQDLFEEDARGLLAQTVLGRAIVALLAREREFAVLHCHGEEAALACVFATLERRQKTVFACYSHSASLAFTPREADAVGLSALVEQERLAPVVHAIRVASQVTTATPKRVLGEPGLAQRNPVAFALRARGGDVFPARIGLDASIFNPATCPHLFARYTPFELSGKARNKAMLQSELKLELDPDVTLIGVIEGGAAGMRLLSVLEELVRTDVQLVVQIHDEEAECVRELLALSDRMPHRLQVRLGESQVRSQRILAASDALLLASDRPTLALAAQRYGALPIVCQGDVAAEAVVDLEPSLSSGNGILCDGPNPAQLIAGARRAIAAFNRGRPFERLRARIMANEASWEQSARLLEQQYGGLHPEAGA